MIVNGIRVTLRDWCQCHRGESIEKLIDLYYAAWVKVGGNGTVTVSWS